MVYAVFSVFVLVLVVATSFSGALTRIITDSSDNVSTFITNSNGNSWEATTTNIQLAIYDLNGTTGEVKIPPGYFELDKLIIPKHVTVIGSGSLSYGDAQYGAKGGTQFNLSYDTDTIILQGGRLWSCKVQCTNYYNGTAINITEDGGGYGDQDEIQHIPLLLEDVCILNNIESNYSTTGKGVTLWAWDGGDWLHDYHIGPGNTLSDVVIMGFEYGLYLTAESGSYVNANIFSNFELYGNKYDITLTGSTSANIFNNIQIEGRANSTHAIWIQGGEFNQFKNVHIYDWHHADGETIVIAGNRNIVSGYLNIGINGINITGVGNKLDVLPLENNVYTVYPNGYKDGTHIHDVLEDKDEGKIIFMPGTYDIDKTINNPGKFELYFHPGAIFEVNASFTGDYVLYVGKNSLIHGHGVIDGKNVSGVAGIRAGSEQTIEGFEIKNMNSDGIYLYYGSKTIINDCIIKDGWDEGIYLRFAKNNTIQNCIISGNNGYGIEFKDSLRCTIDNNNINNNNVYGIFTDPGSDYNIFINNRIYSEDYGIYVDTGINCTISNNRIEKISNKGIITTGTNTTITNNYVEGAVEIIDHDSATNALILNNIGYNHNSLFPYYEQNTAPTIIDNCTAYWYDLDDDCLYQITNSYGSVWYVNMTKTI